MKGGRRSCAWAVLSGPIGLRAAIGANPANFGPADGYLDATVARDLPLEIFVKLALEFADLAATHAGNVDVVLRGVAFVEVTVASKMEQVELIDQSVPLEQVDRTVDGNARDIRIDFLRTFQDFVRIQMPAGRLDHLQQDATLAREANAAHA